MTIFERAVDLISTGDIVGLGSGRASMAFIKALGERVKAGLKIQGVPTSNTSEDLARSLGIPLVELTDDLSISLTVDGADEVGPNMSLIKGWGRALIREKVVAAASKKLIILVGQDKIVQQLGQRGKLPVEVVSFAMPFCRGRLKEMGLNPVLWMNNGQPAKTDNGNFILDCMVSPPLPDAPTLETNILAIPGVVGTGLFVGMASMVLVGDENNNFEFVRELTT